ncbi:cyclodeaminase [Benzoatithermus flavus]|uniref:Cyclodeaminase n=1 Tax=Benzoatithermus flavus TaxID=3108223 RepID=A0ABU8XXE3_9PROT
MDIVVLDEAALRARVKISHEAMAVVEAAFAALGRGGVVMPPVLHLDLPERHAEMDVKTAYVPGLPSMALKVSTGFFDNPKRGLPSLSGMMTLLSAETGRVEAVLLDNGYLTDVRTALAGAIAADRLARPDARIAGIIGTGLQARLQLEALRLVRPIQRVLLWGRDPAKAAALAGELKAGFGLPVTAAPAEQVVREADIVVTTTAAREPVILADWLHPGLHVTAMGSDAPGKQELDPEILSRADRVVVDRRSQCERLGELRAALAAGTISSDRPIDELGEIVAGLKPGRRSADEITVCDLTGTGAQDTAIAVHAVRAAA